MKSNADAVIFVIGYSFFRRLSPFRRTAQFPDIILDPFFGFSKVRETALITSKGRRVVIAAAVLVDGGVGNMEHFVKENILHYKAGDHIGVE